MTDRSRALQRTAALVAAIASLMCGAALAWNYPTAPTWVVVAFLSWAVFTYAVPYAWLLLLPALLPIVGFASWTGWFTFEEIDILVLGAGASGYFRIALRAHSSTRNSTGAARRHRRAASVSLGNILLIVVFALYGIVSLYRGFDSAGALELGWWHGYHDALNSLRIFKGYALAVLLAPLLAHALARDAERATQWFFLGAAIGFAGACAAIVWERLAFTELLNFSTEYRVTGLFWEMHVGGAALDGFLALTLPFVVWHLMRPQSGLRLVLAMGLLGLGVYGCLVTFSRGLYIAVLVSLAVLAVLRWRQADDQSRRGGRAHLVKGAVFVATVVAIDVLVFRSGGYRMLAAVVAAFAVSLVQFPVARRATWPQWLMALVAGTVLGVGGWIVAERLFKGPYVLFAIAVICSAGLGITLRESRSKWTPVVVLSTYVWVVVAAAMIAQHWGGEAALLDGMLALSILVGIAVWSARAATPLWPTNGRSLAMLLGAVALVGAIVVVFNAGALMGNRFATGERDLAGRMEHWGDIVAMLHGPADWFLGKGLGRFPASYFYELPDRGIPGSYRVRGAGERAFLALGGPRHTLGFNELFRVSQRVTAASPGTYYVALDARAKDAVSLHLEICEKHLLYHAGCAQGAFAVKPSAADWQRVVVSLDGSVLKGGSWYAPRLRFFSLAVKSSGRLLEIDNVSVIGPDGRNEIENGDFSSGMAHWFFTSDRNHLPWHIKNLYLNVLFEQGVTGLCLFVLLAGSAWWRVAAGTARSHPLAPYLAASLTGFLVGGVFDSLLDVPRVGFLFYFLVMMTLMLRPILATVETRA